MKKGLIVLLLFFVTVGLLACDKNTPCDHQGYLVNESLIQPDCINNGKTEGLICSYCGEVIIKSEIIPSPGHTFDGLNDKVCNVCGYFNSTNPSFIVSETTVSNDQKTAKITVALKNNPGVASIVLSVGYDHSNLILSNVTYNQAIGGQTIFPDENGTNIVLYWINASENVSGDFVFATLDFDLVGDNRGEYDIRLSYDSNNVFNYNEDNVAFDVINGKIIFE